ncbi:MAG TPA: hypothetical protein VH092_06720 [Urbifossiella sp.]|jgi:hypothetical protein|nr:hypothetical protein [Urbifossiella sp.]
MPDQDIIAYLRALRAREATRKKLEAYLAELKLVTDHLTELVKAGDPGLGHHRHNQIPDPQTWPKAEDIIKARGDFYRHAQDAGHSWGQIPSDERAGLANPSTVR